MGEAEGRETIFVRVPSHPKYLILLRRVVGTSALLAGFSESDKAMIVLAVEEAVANCIKHGYEGDHTQMIELLVVDGRETFRVSVRDFGPKPDVDKIAARDLEDVRPGGLGTHFMKSIMDEVEFDTSHKDWNEVRLVRYKGESRTTVA